MTRVYRADTGYLDQAKSSLRQARRTAYRAAMFTVGCSYYLSFWTSAAEGITTNKVKVVEVTMPLVKVRDESGAETIVNTNSAAFVGAKQAED